MEEADDVLESLVTPDRICGRGCRADHAGRSRSAQTTLRVPVVSRTVFYLPAWTAEKQGFFKDEGLDVKIEVYDGSEKIFHDLRAGTHQIAIASIESVIAESYKGGTLRIVAGIAKRPPHFIIAQPEIKTLADLKGKTIGVVSMHEGTTFFVADIAKAGGFALSDVKVEAVGGSPTRARLLKERKIDMGLQPYPLSYEAEAQGFTNLGAMAKLVPDYQFVSVMVDENWASKNRAGARRLSQGAATRHRIHVRASRRIGGARRQGAAHQPGFCAARARGHAQHGHHVARSVADGRQPAAGVQHHAAGRCAWRATYRSNRRNSSTRATSPRAGNSERLLPAARLDLPEPRPRCLPGASSCWMRRAAIVPLPIAVAIHGCAGLATSPTANTPRQDVSMLPSTTR